MLEMRKFSSANYQYNYCIVVKFNGRNRLKFWFVFKDELKLENFHARILDGFIRITFGWVFAKIASHLQISLAANSESFALN